MESSLDIVQLDPRTSPGRPLDSPALLIFPKISLPGLVIEHTVPPRPVARVIKGKSHNFDLRAVFELESCSGWHTKAEMPQSSLNIFCNIRNLCADPAIGN